MIRTRAKCAALFLLRQDVRLWKWWVKQLRRRNTDGQTRIISSTGPIVSLTTFGERLDSVYLAIESIGAGSVLPSRIILWLQDRDIFNSRPHTIRNLEARGLETRITTSYGPHSKYYPYVESTSDFLTPLITADDDMLYPRWWLAGLLGGHRLFPDDVNCYRARVVSMKGAGLAPYRRWKLCHSTLPDIQHFATGCSGCLYPPSFLERLKAAGRGFTHTCAFADDVWLHVNAIRAGIRVRQVYDRPMVFPFIPGSQGTALFKKNLAQDRNDEQITATYTRQDLDRLQNCLRKASDTRRAMRSAEPQSPMPDE